MNVSFDTNEKINGYIITNNNGLTQFTASNTLYAIVFHTDAGEGRNYCKVIGYHDFVTGRSYHAQRYLQKFISTVQGFSNVLYKKYQEKNN